MARHVMALTFERKIPRVLSGEITQTIRPYNPNRPIRNQKMLDEGKPDIVVAFHNSIENSRGTKDMLNRATKHAIPTILVKEGENK